MSSILTNTSALVALQTLKSINASLGKVQNEISTGMKVATAKDNSSWAIAATMRSDVNGLGTLSDALTSASATVGVARNAAEPISDILTEIQEKVVQAQNPDADTAKLDADLDRPRRADHTRSPTRRSQRHQLRRRAGDGGRRRCRIQRASAAGSPSRPLTVTAGDLSAPRRGDHLADQADDDVEARAATTAVDAAAAFGAAQIHIEAQNDFLRKQADALKVGIGALVDADMEEASARLQALQVQQQLGIQALSIANQSPQNVLALFR